jgi:hypothetical protein
MTSVCLNSFLFRVRIIIPTLHGSHENEIKNKSPPGINQKASTWLSVAPDRAVASHLHLVRWRAVATWSSNWGSQFK